MKSDFERKNYILRYVICSVVSFLLIFFVCLFALDISVKKTFFIIMIILIVLVLVFIVTYAQYNKILSEIENASEVMLKAALNENESEGEKFMQGDMGIMYSNMYKMINAIKESRNKELSEKEFLRDIISDISHQLKTPLASLKVFNELLLDERIDEDKKHTMFIESQNQLSRMEWMVLSMLKLARLESGAVKYDIREVQVADIFSIAKSGVSYLTEERNQKINIICSETTTIKCDRGWLAEAVINLLKNASDYSDKDTEITLEAEENNAFTRIYVKDTGMGIPENEMANIFNRFYRVHHEVNPNSIGIGLPLCKSIVEAMGGRLSVRSEEGKYTWFIITIVK